MEYVCRLVIPVLLASWGAGGEGALHGLGWVEWGVLACLAPALAFIHHIVAARATCVAALHSVMPPHCTRCPRYEHALGHGYDAGPEDAQRGIAEAHGAGAVQDGVEGNVQAVLVADPHGEGRRVAALLDDEAGVAAVSRDHLERRDCEGTL